MSNLSKTNINQLIMVDSRVTDSAQKGWNLGLATGQIDAILALDEAGKAQDAGALATTYSGGGDGVNSNRFSVTMFDPRTEGSADASITSLLTGGKWGTAIGSGASLYVSYSRVDSTYASYYGTESHDENIGVQDFSATQIDGARKVMAALAAVANITFTETYDTATNAGDIRWAQTNNWIVETAWAYFPQDYAEAGDIWIGPNYSSYYGNPVIGGYGYLTYLHELGHALGLLEPHNSLVAAEPGEDQLKYSIMSYRDFAGDDLDSYESSYFPTTLMINDILAIQFLYGSNTSYHTGNDIYQWDPTKSVYETIWDTSGIDTIDASNQTVLLGVGVRLDLNSGQWCQIGSPFWNGQGWVRDCLTIAYGTIIENATGSAFADILIGNSADNILNGGAGTDSLIGGTGNDTYYVDVTGDSITEAANAGSDIVYSTATDYTLAANVESLVISGAGVNGTGNDDINYLFGNALNNTLDGKGGADGMAGGAGNDTYYVDVTGDSITEAVNAGSDIVYSTAADYTLAANVESLVISGAGVNGTGNDDINYLFGNALNNTLDGKGGADGMAGGAGNDTYYVDVTGDSITEAVNAGSDIVYSTAADYTLAANVENLVIWGAGVNGTGNDDNNYLFGNALNNTLDGKGGADIMAGGEGADSLIGGTGNDTYYVDVAGDSITEAVNEGSDIVYSTAADYTLAANVETLVIWGEGVNGTGNDNNYLFGSALNNTLDGKGGADIMAGGEGADSLIGGTGNDTYYVDVAGDSITEAVNEGSDIVYSTAADYTLVANVESLVVWGAGVNGTGNDDINYLFGNALNNTLDGKSGADGMVGGGGNDTYIVDNTGDVVTENPNQGLFDTVNSSISYNLTANVEVLTLIGILGTEALNGNGNGDANYLYGNAGNNILDGKAGADVMIGKAGNDTYYVDNTNDVILEYVNEGTDSVISSVSYSLSALDPTNAVMVAGANAENLTITGAAIYAFGNDLNNNLIGNSNNNIIGAGAGVDTMTGGAGDDTYYVDVAGDTVIEQAGEGADIAYSMATDYTLSDNIETIVVWGAGLNGTGNAQDNYVFGNTYGGGAVNNILGGGGGNDILMGFDGADTYIGGTDQDTYNLTEQIAAIDTIQIAAGDSVATIGLMDKAAGFALGINTVSSAGVDKLHLDNSSIAQNTTTLQDGTDAGVIQTNSITDGIISFQGVGGAIAVNSLSLLSDALTYLQTNITDGSSVAFVALSTIPDASISTYVFQDGGVTDTVVELVGVHATSMNNTGLAAGAVWLV